MFLKLKTKRKENVAFFFNLIVPAFIEGKVHAVGRIPQCNIGVTKHTLI
jgi:hypothetical protein